MSTTCSLTSGTLLQHRKYKLFLPNWIPISTMRYPHPQYAKLEHDPKLGSQAKCLTITQHTSMDDDLSDKGKVADKTREIVSDSSVT